MCAINSRRSDKMLNAASTEAYRSQMRFRHGAVILKGGKLLASGHNHVRTRFSGPLASNDAIVLPFDLDSGSSSSSAYDYNSSESSHQSSAASASSNSSSAAHSSSSSAHATGSSSGTSDASAGGSHSVGQHSFSMHAEMHAITSALRGARPQRHKSHLSVDPQMAALALAFSFQQQQTATKKGHYSSHHNNNPKITGKKKKKQKQMLKQQGTTASPAIKQCYSALPAQAPWGKKKAKGGGASSAYNSNHNTNKVASGGSPMMAGGVCGAVGTSAAGMHHSGEHSMHPGHGGGGAAVGAAGAEGFHNSSGGGGSGFGAPSPRLRGADMYVVRLLQDAESKARARARRRALTAPSRSSPLANSSWTGDEAGPSGNKNASSVVERGPKYADSRPCWRCLKWMEWAGIKRVFWTDDQGVWEGAKVVQLLYGPFPLIATSATASSSSASSDVDSDSDSGPSYYSHSHHASASGSMALGSSSGGSYAPMSMMMMHPAIHITRYEQAAIVQAAARGAASKSAGAGHVRKKGRG
ncbi:hypothetical protein OC861_000108 [Tilletia horrida]|nr:hypothetical protein OC861_000108 [Tilletia horrida]